LAGGHTLRDQPEAVEQAAGGGVGGEFAEKGLRGDDGVQQFRELVHWQQQQAVMAVEGRIRRVAGIVEVGLVGIQRGVQGVCRFGRFLWCGGADDRDDQRVELREVFRLRDLRLPPGQMGGEQMVGVRVDPQVLGGVGEAGGGQSQSGDDDKHGVAARGADDTDDQGKQNSASAVWTGAK
jgi:hypothetical protein